MERVIPMNETYHPVTNAQELDAALLQVRAAQNRFATYSQEQVDRIFLAAATAANRARIPLAKMAVAETGMGIVYHVQMRKNTHCMQLFYPSSHLWQGFRDSD